ncbi:MAG: hypothetical protein WD717_06175 [Nitrosarchaeum sp.]
MLPSYAIEIKNYDYFSNTDYKIYSLLYKQFEYHIPYKISGTSIKNMILDCNSYNLLINLQQSDNGIMEINMPKKMLETEIDGVDSFLVLVNGVEVNFEETYSDENSKTLKIIFPNDAETIEIIVSNVSQFPKHVICGIGGIDDSPYYQLLPPLKQSKSGTLIDNIICRENFILVIKANNDSPACVTQKTSEKLIERGWAKLI